MLTNAESPSAATNSKCHLLGVFRILLLTLIAINQVPCECLKFCAQSSARDHVGGRPQISHLEFADQNPFQAPSSSRLKRSPLTATERKFDLWDHLERLLVAYQMHQQHDQALGHGPGNFQTESPDSHKVDKIGETNFDHRLAPRQPRISETGGERRQFLSNRQGQPSESSDDDQAASISQPAPAKVIETAVFIDQALDNRFTGLSNGLVELNKLVLAIMNQVQYLFEYSSLQLPIKLKLVLVEHLRESERLAGMPAPNPERGDIDAYLSNFCNWQQSRLQSEKRLWWDHAILLSGLDLYKATPGKNHNGVLGLAWVGGMCKGNYSCTINEASNFESAFVIAHEIGHSLGIMHDGQKNKCDPNSFIMSERTGAGKVHWSKCSNAYLNDSIQKGQLKCLDSEQNNQIDSLYDLTKLRAPGQVYTINEQCRLAFGNNYSSFIAQQSPFNAVCRELWCVSGTWAKAAHPALEGSSCGQQELVCREGKCIRVVQ